MGLWWSWSIFSSFLGSGRMGQESSLALHLTLADWLALGVVEPTLSLQWVSHQRDEAHRFLVFVPDPKMGLDGPPVHPRPLGSECLNSLPNLDASCGSASDFLGLGSLCSSHSGCVQFPHR